MRRRRTILVWGVAAVLVAAMAVGALVFWRGRKSAYGEVPDEFRFKPIRVVGAHAVLAECPLATTACLYGAHAEAYRRIFENAGVFTAGVPGPDIVFAAGAEADWRTLGKTAVASNGVYAWAFDTRKLTVGGFREMLRAFSKPLQARGASPELHLWMVGENDWLLVGHPERASVRLADLFDRFADEGSVNELVEASCVSLSDLLAGYVGTDAELMPAFSGDDLSMTVRPEFFVPKDVPDVGWIDCAGIDEDIRLALVGDYHAVQLARRTALEGNMLALEEGKSEAAIDKWAAALARNPHDTMLLDRLYRLTVNARAFERVGNWKAAAKCYETLVSVRPSDAAAMTKFGECLQALGEKELSMKALKKGKEMMR